MRTEAGAAPKLERELGLGHATALNMIDMIGIGPFITIPLVVSAMGGPQAMLGWIFGALLAVVDGLVWAELGAAMPGSGGSYRYLKEIYGAQKLGRMLSFLFIFQLSFSAPLSMASGSVGLTRYLAYLVPQLDQQWFAQDLAVNLGFLGTLQARIVVGWGTVVAIGAVALVVIMLYRRITIIGQISKVLWAVTMGTILWVIVAGLSHFDAARAFDFPADAFRLDGGFFLGVGAATLVSTYTYWGYYNVCFFGDEVKEPARNIPRAMLLSIAAITVLYVVMNISVLGVIPWQELDQAAKADTRYYIISILMERVYGHWAAIVVTILIVWTAFASVFALVLGYSRAPYAAALDGNYFKVMGKVHPKLHFPHVSLLSLGAMGALFCFLRLADIIAALVVIRIIIQFLVQTVGLLYLRATRPEFPRPFRMWLYPLPALLAIAGFTYLLLARPNFIREVRYAAIIAIAGLAIYLVRSWKRREWPFGSEKDQVPST